METEKRCDLKNNNNNNIYIIVQKPKRQLSTTIQTNPLQLHMDVSNTLIGCVNKLRLVEHSLC